MRIPSSFALGSLALTLLLGALPAADWPQWRGPERTGVSKEKGLLKSWPKAGPKLLWTHEEAGIGYGGPAIVGDRLYLMGGDGKKEYLFALDVQSGKRLWRSEVGDFYRNAWGGGPRGTPTVHDGMIYAIGGQGALICVRADNGKLVWSKDLQGDLGGGIPRWGYAESPLVDGDRVVCTPGGRNGTLAALDRKTGKLLWRSTDVTSGAQYASIIAADHQGKRQYIQLTMDKLFGVDADKGGLLWETDFPGRIAVVPTPLFHDGKVYATAGYGAGCKLMQLDRQGKASEVYANSVMQNHHGGVILLDGHIYGYSDRGGWICQKFDDGKQVWSSRALGKGSIAHADGHFYCYAERDGTCVLIEASTAGWKEKGRFRIPQQSKTGRDYNNRSNLWTHPVIANGRLYLRDQELLFCYEVK